MADTTSPAPNNDNAVDTSEGRRDLAKALLLCLLAVVIVRSFLLEPFKIPSSSMMPSLIIGDHIFVSKFNYGLSLPFTKIELAAWSSPKRGDVVVFLFPRDESLHYIKRVVGLPNDRVEFRGKDLVINGQVVRKEKITDPVDLAQLGSKDDSNVEYYREYLDEHVHLIRHSKGKGAYDFSKNIGAEVVPPDKFFVVGDNRDDSYDSRSWGFVPKENIKGKAQMVWLSLDSRRGLGLGKVRWSRCGTLIH